MNDFKPISEWTAAELVKAAQERGTGMDPIFDEMLRRLEADSRDEIGMITFGDGTHDWRRCPCSSCTYYRDAQQS